MTPGKLEITRGQTRVVRYRSLKASILRFRHTAPLPSSRVLRKLLAWRNITEIDALTESHSEHACLVCDKALGN